MFLSTTTPAVSSSTHLMLPKTLHSRRLLQPLFHYPQLTPTSQHIPPAAQPPYNDTTTTFDANVVMTLLVLLCALICSLVLNSVIRCMFRCISRTSFGVTPMTTSTTVPMNHLPKSANTGIKKKALKTFTTVTYSTNMKLLGGECVICLSEFTSGEKLRLLPRCNHGFHLRCIDKWLDSHSSCPTCRNCLIQTYEKIVGEDNQQSATSSMVLAPLPTPPPQQTIQQPPPPLPLEETVVNMAAIEPQDPTRN